MNIDRVEMGPVTVLRISGDVDEEGVAALRIGLLDCLREKRFLVVVNLSGAGYISYLGIGVLLERMRQLRQQGGDLRLVGVNLYMQRVFRMAGVSSILVACESEGQAVQGMREAA